MDDIILKSLCSVDLNDKEKDFVTVNDKDKTEGVQRMN